MAQTLTYPAVSADQWGKIKTALAQNGINIAADSGVIDSHGVDATYDYAAPALTVTVVHAPWIIGISHAAGMIDAKIKEQLT